MSVFTLLSAEGQSPLLFSIKPFTSTSFTHKDFKNRISLQCKQIICQRTLYCCPGCLWLQEPLAIVYLSPFYRKSREMNFRPAHPPISFQPILNYSSSPSYPCSSSSLACSNYLTNRNQIPTHNKPRNRTYPTSLNLTLTPGRFGVKFII